MTDGGPFVFEPAAGGGPPRKPPSGGGDVRAAVAETLRHIADAADELPPPPEFMRTLLSAVESLMPAGPVSLWRIDDPPAVLHAVGGTLIDDPDRVSELNGLLRAVAADGRPVVVPPSDIPPDDGVGNPTPHRLALAPLPGRVVDASRVLVVSLPGASSPAVDRGYLRLLAQVADLAGGYFASRYADSLRRTGAITRRIDEAAGRIAATDHPDTVRECVVDTLAELDIDQVAWVDGDGTLRAVSHCESIDVDAPGSLRIVTRWRDGSDPDVIRHDGGSALVIDGGADPIDDDVRAAASRLLLLADTHLRRGRPVKRLRPRTGVVLTFAAALAAAWVPIPHRFTADATLGVVGTVHLAADGSETIRKVHVRDGQNVAAGDPIVTVEQPALDDEYFERLGRRDVLRAERDRLNDTLAGTRNIDAEDRRRLVVEELRAIESELELLASRRERSVRRAAVAGRIDAPEIDRLAGRPMTRGEVFARILPGDAAWSVTAATTADQADAIWMAESPAAIVRIPATGITARADDIEITGVDGDSDDPLAAATMRCHVVAADRPDHPLWRRGGEVRISIDLGHRPVWKALTPTADRDWVWGWF